jgi:hypothetical protein
LVKIVIKRIRIKFDKKYLAALFGFLKSVGENLRCGDKKRKRRKIIH